MRNGRGKNPVVSLCTYSFEKNCDLNLSQMAVVRLKILKNHLNNCMTNALQFKDLNMNSNLRYSRLRHKFEINQIEDGQGSL